MTSRPSQFTMSRPGKLRLYSTAELLRLPPPEWLIENIMPVGGLVGLYGPPGVGKSFVAMDMAMCVATGSPWQGRVTKRGYALYIAAEGGGGIGKRVNAWFTNRGLTASSALMAWVMEAVPVTNDNDDMDHLFWRIKTEVQIEPDLVIIDTLARCFDGDENTQLDMGRFVKGVDRFRTELQCAVMVVHHTRLDGERERGNTALRGAADTMLSLSSKAPIAKISTEHQRVYISTNKQKDSEEAETIVLQKKVIPDADSCVMVGEVPNAKSACLAVLENTNEDGLGFTALMKAIIARGQVSQKTAKRAITTLRESGEIIKENKSYRINRGHEDMV